MRTPPLPWLTRLDARLAARAVTTVLVVLCAISAAQLTWLLVPEPVLPAAQVAADMPPRGETRALRLDAVAAMHLFGKPEAAAPPAAPQVNAPETSLNLILRGLFAGTRKEAAFAIIAEGHSSERYFRLGDQVAGDAVVHDILPDRVVLERAGRYETLRLPKERLEMATPAASAPRGNAAASSTLTGRLRELRESIKNNPQEIMNMAEILPVVQDGQLRGYRIQPRRHQELFRAAGLSPDDVVTAVNGIPVTDPAQFAKLTTQLAAAATLRLSLERPDGSADEISIHLH